MRRNVVVVSDLHAGCQLALCPPSGAKLDNGGVYLPSEVQQKLWGFWTHFWREWVPLVTKGEPFDLVVNGDAMDGVHHGSTTQISHNLFDQAKIAAEVMAIPLSLPNFNNLYWTRGTSAHVGESGVEEERLAASLGAIPNKEGQYARNELWMRVGDALVNIMHHIGTTGSSAYESTAVHKELIEHYVEAARHREEPPDVIVRSHRHRGYRTSFAASVKGDSRDAIAVVTPGWQLRTPFCFKIAGARITNPQFGGILIRSGDEDPIYVRHQTYHLSRGEVE